MNLVDEYIKTELIPEITPHHTEYNAEYYEVEKMVIGWKNLPPTDLGSDVLNSFYEIADKVEPIKIDVVVLKEKQSALTYQTELSSIMSDFSNWAFKKKESDPKILNIPYLPGFEWEKRIKEKYPYITIKRTEDFYYQKDKDGKFLLDKNGNPKKKKFIRTFIYGIKINLH